MTLQNMYKNYNSCRGASLVRHIYAWFSVDITTEVTRCRFALCLPIKEQADISACARLINIATGMS